MRVAILGPLEVVDDGVGVDIGGARLRSLLIGLSLQVGRTVAPDTLAAAVWPGDGPTDPVNALQSLVSRLRRALPADRLLSVPGGYRLDLPADAVDAHRFERLAGEGHRSVRDGEPEMALRLLREALGLWRGELPAEAPDAAHRRLAELRLTAAEDHAAAALALGRTDGLVAELEGLAAAHPFRERLRGLVIRALHADGRQAEALASYEEFRGFLAAELGADPGAELKEAHVAALRGETAPRRRTGNLPAPATGFVGRAAELDRIAARLDAGRLVTLVGPGGAGKSRLAAEAAGRWAPPVWLVELGPVTDPDAVAHAAADALGARDPGLLSAPVDPLDGVTRALAGTSALLVLDGCEHLVDAAAALAGELLRRCPGLRIVATSREPLGIPGEAVCPVGPLPGEEAVRLFADRAAAVRPGFAVTPGNAADIGALCERLDGLPLAVELAAALLRSLPLDELVDRLGDGLDIPESRTGRPADPRHRTLRAVVAWSWRLLAEDERRLARRLAVFPGGVTVESAEAVGGAGADLLAALADRSVLRFDGRRYSMLATIRAYGREELVRSGELTRARVAHAAYFTGLAERAVPYLKGADQLPWIARLAAERGNLTAALRFCCDTGDAATALRLCAALGLYWLIRGDHRALAHWPGRALRVPGPAPSAARSVTRALHLLVPDPGRHDGPLAEEIRRLPAEPDAADPIPESALVEPFLAFAAGDADTALAAVDRRLGHPDPWVGSVLRLMRALLVGGGGDMAGMRRELVAAVAGFRDLGERGGLAWSLTALADVHTNRGSFEDAVAALEEAVRLLRALDPDDDAVLQRVWIAEARYRSGDTARARADLRGLMGGDDGASLPERYRLFARITTAALARRDGDRRDAARQLALAREDIGSGADANPAYAFALECGAAELARDGGDLAAARRHLAAAFDTAVSGGDGRQAAIAAAHSAVLLRAEGRSAEAVEQFGAALALIGAPDVLDADLQRLDPDLRAELGERAYEAALARGRGLDPEAALALIGSLLS
ncbi:putative ATPase [Murinocardiopsis flavida]|uniref:Putative ATPase n=1 Tax=Murinocardiopsis flavida TaxID=645275 RepID=A0A2P8CLU5_9ACTN|nr:BTAD domain-containing putative transcriptional regulator [Murinocardiopsis flavida]PSK85948.1 putative ATPase [Murinocardiopsis flavida]